MSLTKQHKGESTVWVHFKLLDCEISIHVKIKLSHIFPALNRKGLIAVHFHCGQLRWGPNFVKMATQWGLKYRGTPSLHLH